MTNINGKLRLAAFEKKRRSFFGKEKSRQADAMDAVRRELRASRYTFPPANLKTLARYLGVACIREVPLAMRGRVLMDGGEIIIELNEQLELSKRRFTLAHELAHLILERERAQSSNAQGSAVRRGEEFAYNQIEKLCDMAAAEILLPSDWFQRRTFGLPASLGLVSDIAKETDCPIYLVANRAVEIWDCRFLWWRHLDGKFEVFRSVPYENDEELSFYLPLESESILGRCLKAGDLILQDQCLISNGIVRDHYYVECVAAGKDIVLAMVRVGRRGYVGVRP